LKSWLLPTLTVAELVRVQIPKSHVFGYVSQDIAPALSGVPKDDDANNENVYKEVVVTAETRPLTGLGSPCD
jgi:hypothetical protein